jgi:Fuc2NAc and GlcNAc transferase
MVVAFEIVLGALLLVGQITVSSWSLFACGGFAIALIGFLDDLRSIRASIRLMVHLAVALLAAGIILRSSGQALQASAAESLSITSICVVVVWGINSFNFMDGIDGIAAMQAIFMAGGGSVLNGVAAGPLWITLALACLAAAAAGFLVFNWPPAKIFMGDGASGFLGFTFAAFALVPHHAPLMSGQVWIILDALFLLDASLTLLRRALRGEPFFEPHRLHAYQHLARRWGHPRITKLYSLVNALWLFPWAYFAVVVPNLSSLAVMCALMPVALGLLVSGAGDRETPNRTLGL